MSCSIECTLFLWHEHIVLLTLNTRFSFFSLQGFSSLIYNIHGLCCILSMLYANERTTTNLNKTYYVFFRRLWRQQLSYSDIFMKGSNLFSRVYLLTIKVANFYPYIYNTFRRNSLSKVIYRLFLYD